MMVHRRNVGLTRTNNELAENGQTSHIHIYPVLCFTRMHRANVYFTDFTLLQLIKLK